MEQQLKMSWTDFTTLMADVAAIANAETMAGKVDATLAMLAHGAAHTPGTWDDSVIDAIRSNPAIKNIIVSVLEQVFNSYAATGQCKVATVGMLTTEQIVAVENAGIDATTLIAVIETVLAIVKQFWGR